MTSVLASPGVPLTEHPDTHQEDSEFAVLARTMVQALEQGRTGEAEFMYARLCMLDPRAENVLIFPVLFAIQRGQVMQALQRLNQLPAQRCPELRVLCLSVLGDPIWHSEATALLDSPKITVRQAMRQLLDMPAQSLDHDG
jgi:type III secretion protein HrpB1